MSRISSAETIQIRATNNIYTVLVAAALVVDLVALIAVITRYNTLYGQMPWAG